MMLESSLILVRHVNTLVYFKCLVYMYQFIFILEYHKCVGVENNNCKTSCKKCFVIIIERKSWYWYLAECVGFLSILLMFLVSFSGIPVFRKTNSSSTLFLTSISMTEFLKHLSVLWRFFSQRRTLIYYFFKTIIFIYDGVHNAN